MPDTPWFWLIGGGLVLVIASFVYVGLTEGETTKGVYVAPQYVNGKIVPGHVDEGRTAMSDRLDPKMHGWMTAPGHARGDGCADARMAARRASSAAAVRNALLGRDVDDIDIATPLTPDEVTKRLEAAGLGAVPTGIEHGTVTAIANGKPFEITTLRRDVSTDGRHAVVAFTTDWEEDAAAPRLHDERALCRCGRRRSSTISAASPI